MPNSLFGIYGVVFLKSLGITIDLFLASRWKSLLLWKRVSGLGWKSSLVKGTKPM